MRARTPEAWPPPRLQDTGLYSDWATRTVSSEHLPFSPQYPLWTDGAGKRRWIYIPPGTAIDASNPDLWTFPVGTRLWKEFRFARRAETRFIEHTREGWRYATYVWSDDEGEAALAPERGIAASVEIAGGVRHTIPSRSDCRACHEAGPTRVLGFGALQLSSARDPLAAHAEGVPEGGVDLKALAARGLIRGLPAEIGDSPAIEARTPTERAALGYLHANCGTCHSEAGELANLDLSLHYPLVRKPGADAPALVTTVGRVSTFAMPDTQGQALRIRPGDPQGSVLYARMGSRHPVRQMPPLGSNLADDQGLSLIRQWIAEIGTRSAP